MNRKPGAVSGPGIHDTHGIPLERNGEGSDREVSSMAEPSDS